MPPTITQDKRTRPMNGWTDGQMDWQGINALQLSASMTKQWHCLHQKFTLCQFTQPGRGGVASACCCCCSHYHYSHCLTCIMTDSTLLHRVRQVTKERKNDKTKGDVQHNTFVFISSSKAPSLKNYWQCRDTWGPKLTILTSMTLTT